MARRSTLFAAMACVRLTSALVPGTASLRPRAAARLAAPRRGAPIAMMMSTTTPPLTPDKHVLVAVADGSEEIETTIIVDTLVRGGAKVTVASVSGALQVQQIDSFIPRINLIRSDVCSSRRRSVGRNNSTPCGPRRSAR